MKIIWHIKSNDCTTELKDEITNKIKEFHDNSMVIFGYDIEITILDT